MVSLRFALIGFEDVGESYKQMVKPAPVVAGVQGYVFKVLTIHHDHGHGGIVHSADSGSNNTNINIGGNGGGGGGGHFGQEGPGGIPPSARPFSISQITSEPFGVFASLQECDMARAAKIAELDARGARIMHQSTPYVMTGTSIGPNGYSSTIQSPASGPSERQDVTFCESGTYSRKLMPEMMKDPGGGIDPQDLRKIQFQPSPTQPTVIEVPPGFVKHWVAPRPFTRAIPGTSDAIEILSAHDRELVFMVKSDNVRPTNILLVNDDGEVVANLRIVIPNQLNTEPRQGPEGTQIYRKDNPDYVAPKEKK